MFTYTCRLGLIAAIAAMTYVALLPAYDFGTWVPEQLLNFLNFPDTVIRTLLARADKFAHFIGAMTITFLYFASFASNDKSESNEPSAQQPNAVIFLSGLFALALVAEVAQFIIGRSFSSLDIVAGVTGGALGLASINYLRISDRLKTIKA